MRTAYFVGVLISLLALANAFAEDSSPAKLIFLGNQNIAPVVYLENSTPTGVVVDIVHALAPHLPQPIEIKAINWQEAQALVARGEADALIQINQTEERIKIYDFSEPLLESQFSIFTSTDKVAMAGISSLQGFQVGVEAGGLPQQLLEKYPRVRLTIIPNFLAGFKLLNQGVIDAVVVDYRVGSYVIAENQLRDIRVNGEPVAFSYSSIAVKKGNTKLLAAINNALQIIKTDGSYQKVLDDWKPKEGVFQTHEQITHQLHYLTILVLLVLFLIAVIWTVTLRKELVKRKATEERLRQQYSTLSGIINSTTALIFSVDRQYRYTSFNLGHTVAMKALYGAEIELGHSLLDYMSVTEDRQTARRNLDRALAGEQLVKEAFSGEELRSRQYFQVSHSPISSDEGIIGVAVLTQDMSERKRAEDERLVHLRFFESMDRVNRAIQGADALEQMMSDVLDVVRSIFDCDRAFLMYPCDPEAATWRVPMERTTPDYPGVLGLGRVMPMDEQVAATLRILLDAEGAVKFGPGTAHPLPADVAERFGFKCFMSMALRPKGDKPWQFGIHQCSHARAWTATEERLLQEIGRRLADGLTNLASRRDLEISEAKYRCMIDTANEGIWTLGPDLLTTSVNPQMAEILGRSCEEMIGRPATDFMFEEDAPDQLRKMENRRQGLSEHYERRLRRKDGGTAWTLASATPVFDEERHFQGSFVMVTDITERKRIEDQLRKLSLAVEQSPESIVITNLKAEIEYVNEAFVQKTGFSRTEAIGKNPRILHSGKTPAQTYVSLWDALTHGRPWAGEIHNQRKDGSKYIEHCIVTPIRQADGRITHYVAVKEDITVRKRMERHLLESQQLLRQLAARNETAREDERRHLTREIHDELGQYLLALRLGVAVVDIEFGASIAPLREKTQRLLEMVDTTIKVVRNVVTSLRPTALDMGIVSALEWLVHEYSGRTGIQCELHICDEDIYLDDMCTTAIFRIVQESLTNIARHAQANKVEITLERNEAHYLLEVRDNGRGFNPARRKAKSFGLVGIRERALMLGGKVDISSGPGRGTSIRVHIPIHNVVTKSEP